ncbi:hypothetical protein Thermo_01118 [Thermoplasmatales archaeon]|nr:hypothetical protein Thermo_01118 [Thermoplasmatales archaeon]
MVFSGIDQIWSDQSLKFKEFWSTKILNPENEVTQADLEDVIRILDTKGRGNIDAELKAVASLYLRQNMQEELIRNIKNTPKKIELLDQFFKSASDEERINAINELQNFESSNRVAKLTTVYGVFLNAIAYAYDPAEHVNIVSIDKEKRAIDKFEIPIDFNPDRVSYGELLVKANRVILDFFRKMGVNAHTYVIGAFVWAVLNSESEPGNEIVGVFNFERYLGEFLFKNWDQIPEFRKHKILTEDGESTGIEYNAGSGRIDILAIEEGSGDYLVIELKRNQTSDAVAGQILRYVNWVKNNMAGNKKVKGLVIAGDIDERLRLSLADRKDIKLMTYEIDFKLHNVNS